MLKKILFGIAATAFMAGCTDDYTDWAGLKTTAQEELETMEISITPNAEVFDYAGIADDATLSVFTSTVNSNAKDPRTSYLMTFSSGNTIETENGTIAASALKQEVEAQFGKVPVERTLPVTVKAFLKSAGPAYTKDAGTIEIKAKLTAPRISESYYVIGGTLDWAASAASKEQKFSHSSNNVYDDPIFTITIPAVEGDDTWFAFADDEACDGIAAGDWSKVLGTTDGNGNNGLTGKLATRKEIGNEGSLCISKEYNAKFIKIELNMMEYTYKITPLSFNEYIGLVGDHNGWGNDNPIASPAFDGSYEGYSYLTGSFKIRQNESWAEADTWGMADAEGKLAQPGGNITVAEPGFYHIKANIVDMTYSFAKVENISLIGEFNEWGGDVDMTYDEAEKCWKAECTFDADGVFKIRMNHDWTTSWGGKADGDDIANMTAANGNNVNVKAGHHTFKFYLTCEGKSYLVIE